MKYPIGRLLKIIAIVMPSTTVLMQCKSIPQEENLHVSSAVEITYENSIRPIIQDYCITCHSGKDPRGGFTLTSYESVRRKAEHGVLLKRINDANDPMPKGGLMPQEERNKIMEWARTGFPRGDTTTSSASTGHSHPDVPFKPPVITPVDLDREGIELLELMKGHWVGTMDIMGDKYPWFSFDYRPISPSHIHGIFEGGTMGNLFNSFFVANYKGKRTIMARNGGLLNGIYRTSFFVLDEVEIKADKKYFRLVDAYGGKEIMWMELTFSGSSLQFNSYTSRFGMNLPPSPHMQFNAKKMHPQYAEEAGKKFGFPGMAIDKDFSNGLPAPKWGDDYPSVTSASYVWRDPELDLRSLAKLAGDPYPIDQLPYLSQLTVEYERSREIENKKLIVYLSGASLTDDKGSLLIEYGYMKPELFDTVFLFPEITANENSFTFTYLHPGDYFLTIVADIDENGYASPGDISHRSIEVTVGPESQKSIKVDGIQVRN